MVFILTQTWPLSSSSEVLKYLQSEEPLLETTCKTNGPFICVGGDGMKACTVYNPKHQDEAEKFRQEIVKGLKARFSIAGYKMLIESAMTQQEAASLFS